LPELGDQSDSQLFAEDTGNYYRDPTPFSHSDAVVVGNITSGQAYLSNDKRDVYSEFQIIIQEVLKEPSARRIGPGDSIAVERYGGAIRLSSGKVLIRGITEFSMPLVGKRYLLFQAGIISAPDCGTMRLTAIFAPPSACTTWL